MSPKPPKTKRGKKQKMAQVMHEFKTGALQSSSGQKVTKPKQALASGLSEAGLSKQEATGKPARRATKRPPDVVVVQRS